MNVEVFEKTLQHFFSLKAKKIEHRQQSHVRENCVSCSTQIIQKN